jgi:alpha-D-xyloside xylohydrolase
MAGTGKSIGVPLPTQALRTRDVVRSTIVRAEFELRTGDTVQLAALQKTSAFRPLSSADQAMFAARGIALEGAARAGRITVDVLDDRVFRIRYRDERSTPPATSGLTVGEFRGPSRCEWKVTPTAVTARTPAGVLHLNLERWRWEWRSPGGKLVCAGGGEEKNYFNQWDAYGLGISHRVGDSRPIATECFDLRPHEAIYGFGERFIRLNKAGQTIDVDMSDTKGVTTDRAYKNVSFFTSTLGYGVFLNHSARLTAWVGSLSACDLQLGVDDDHLDYFVFVGDLKQVLPLYTQLTGRGPVPPAWSFGFWQSKISYSSAEEILTIVREMRSAGLPCDVIHLDTHWFSRNWFCDLEFDPERFPDPARWIAELRQLGVRVSLWQLPYIPEGSPLFADLAAVDGFVRGADGKVFDCEITFVDGFRGIVGVIDFTNPRAVRVWQDYLRKLFRLGVAVLKTDFGESAPIDGVYADGTPGHRAHNLYPLLYNAAAAAVTDEETGTPIVWARSACAGGQRFPVHWGGDSSPNPANMIPQLEGGLSLGLSGFPFWSQDIGGFMGETSDELLIRWLQWSVFLSHCRIHGFGRRELHRFRPETLQICRDFLRLRYRLLPYLLGTAEACQRESLPFARPLVVEYPHDPNTWSISDEFLCGYSLLVVPLTTADETRRAYLPPDVWYSWWTGHRIDAQAAGCWTEVSEPLHRLPLFLRAGAIVPLGPAMNYVGERDFSPLEIVVAPLARDGERRFSFPQANGGRGEIIYRSAGGRHTLAVRGIEAGSVVVRSGDPAIPVTLKSS